MLDGVGWRRIGHPGDLNLYVFDIPLTSDSVGYYRIGLRQFFPKSL